MVIPPAAVRDGYAAGLQKGAAEYRPCRGAKEADNVKPFICDELFVVRLITGFNSPRPHPKDDEEKRMKTKIPKPPLDDAFTAICKADLHTDCVKEYRFHAVRKWRFDYALPACKIALEVEGGVWTGGRHTSPKGFLGDIEKYNTATLMGWRVFRTTPKELYKKATLDLLRQAAANDTNTLTTEI